MQQPNTATSLDLVRQLLNLVMAAFMVLAPMFALRGRSFAAATETGFVSPPIVPAGYVFSIWGPIYLLACCYAIYQVLPAQRCLPLLRSSGWFTALAFFCTGLWMFLAVARLQLATLACMLILLTSLCAAYLIIQHPPQPTGSSYWLILVPVSLFTGWITVATFANMAAAQQVTGLGSGLLSTQAWSVLFLILAALLGLGLTWIGRGSLWYSGVLIWALIGIIVRHQGTPVGRTMVPLAAVLAGCILAASLIIGRIRG